MTKPEFVTGPDGERREQVYGNVSIVDVSSRSYAEQRAHEIGESRLTESAEDRSGIMGGIRQLWKHNLGREYFRQVEISKARQRVPGWNETSANASTPEQIAKETAKAAIAERFANITADNQDTLLHKEAGERIHENKGTAKESRVKKQLTTFVKDFAIGKYDEVEFNKRKGAFIKEAVKIDPKAMDGMENFADNLLEVAKKIRDQIETLVNAGTAIENIDINLEVTLGRARLGARTETEFNRVDRVMEMVSRSPLRPFAGAISRALGAMSSVHGFVTGGFIGDHEKERIKNDRKLFERQRASGLTFDPNTDRRRQELQETSFNKVSATILADELNQLERALQFDASGHTIATAVEAWAEAEARVKTSDRLKIDLISYAEEMGDHDANKPFESSAKRLAIIETQRTKLDLAMAKLEASLVESIYNSGLTPDQIKALLPPAYVSLGAWMMAATRAQESQFTHPEDGELVTKNRLAAKLGSYQFLWFRKPLGLAMTREQVEAEEARRIAALPRPALPGPISPTPGEGEPPVTPPREEAPEPPVETPKIPDVEVKPFFEVTGSLAEFKDKTGVEYTVSQVKKLYSEYAKTGRFDLVADLRRGTGVSLSQGEMKTLISGLDIFGHSALLTAIPESAALIPWSASLQRIENRLSHGNNPDQDPWRHEVAPMVNSVIAEGLLNVEKPEDGKLLEKFFAEGYGLFYTPELLRSWINLQRIEQASDLPARELSKITEWLGPEYETKTSAEVLEEMGRIFHYECLNLAESRPLTIDTSLLGEEIQAAMENKRRNVIGALDLQRAIYDLTVEQNLAEERTTKENLDLFKPLIVSNLNEEIRQLQTTAGADKKSETQLRSRVYSIQKQIERLNAIAAPVNNEPAALRKFIDELADLNIQDSLAIDQLIASTYLKVYAIEHPVLNKRLNAALDAITIVDYSSENLTAAQLTELTEMIVDKIVREDLPKNFKSETAYYALLRAFKAQNPNENPLAIANSRMDETLGKNSSRKKSPVGAMPEAETKKLLAFRAKHDLTAADEKITLVFSELLQTEMTSKVTDLEARRLIGLSRLDQADGKLAFEAKDYVTAEKLAQKSIKLCNEVLELLEVTRIMAKSDAESAALVEVERKAKIKEEAEKRSETAAEAMIKIEAGVKSLEDIGIEIASLKIDAEELSERLEKIDAALTAGEYQKVTGQLKQFLIDTDRINQIIARLKREHKVKGGNRERGGRGDRDGAPATGGLLLGGAADTGPSTFGGGPTTPRTAPATVPAPATTTTPGAGRTLRRPAAAATPTVASAPATPKEAPAVTAPIVVAAPAARSLRRPTVAPVVAAPEVAPTQPPTTKPPEAIPTPAPVVAATGARTLRRPTPAATPAAAPEIKPAQPVVATKAPETAPTATVPPTRTLRRPPATPAPEASPATPAAGGEIKIEGEDEPFAKTTTPAPATTPTTTPPRRSLRR